MLVSLVTVSHNELCDKVSELDRKSFITIHVRGNPRIFEVCAVQSTKDHPARNTHSPSKKNPDATEQKVDLLIRDLRKNGTNIVHNISVLITDAKYYLAKTPEKCLQEGVRAKKKMYLHACPQDCHYFCPSLTPLIVYLMWRRWLTGKGYPSALKQSVSNPAQGRADTSIVGSPPLWWMPHTSALDGPGFRHIGSVCNARSWRTVLD